MSDRQQIIELQNRAVFCFASAIGEKCDYLLVNFDKDENVYEVHRESWGLAIAKDGHADFHSGCVCFPNPERREQHVRRSVLSGDGVGGLLGG